MKIYKIGQLPESVYPAVGGKAKGLDILARNNFPVPAGFVIADIDSVDEQAIYSAFDALGVNQVSVRSSASNEDQSNASNAGQYETFLFVDRANLIGCVKKCLESIDSDRVKDYAQHFDLGKASMNMNIIIINFYLIRFTTQTMPIFLVQ